MDENTMIIGEKYLQIDSHLSNWCVLERYKRLFHITGDFYKKFEETYSIDLNNRRKQLSEELFKDFIYGVPYYKSLRFCPVCISQGIHLYEHQAMVHQHCVLHPDVELQVTCSSCQKSINLYQSPYRMHITAFSCTCGHKFLKYDDLNDLLNFWEKEFPIDRSSSYFKTSHYKHYPDYFEQVDQHSLTQLYKGNYDFNFKQTIEVPFGVVKRGTFKTRRDIINRSFNNFLSRALYLFPRQVICQFLVNYLHLSMKACFGLELYSDEAEYYLKVLRRLDGDKIDFLPVSYKQLDCYNDFIWSMSTNLILSNAVVHNWFIYHFIQYLCSEQIRTITCTDVLWNPFLYDCQIDKEKSIIILSVQYKSEITNKSL